MRAALNRRGRDDGGYGRYNGYFVGGQQGRVPTEQHEDGE